ncbi:hypothetical protein ACA910_004013 [Epithemia clementina (nom. ined.)]
MLYSVILPTYNERENLPIIVFMLDQVFAKHNLQYEIVIVDDNSPDGTLQVAQTLQKHYGKEKIAILSRPGKLGLGSAYLEGLQKVSKGQRIIIMDADLSHHPKYIPQMIRIMDASSSNHNKKVDIVSGSRYLLQSPESGVCGWDLKRKITSRGANVLAQFLLNPRGCTDLTGSFRLYERHALEKILPRVQCTGYAFQMEILVLAQREGYCIQDVPIVFIDRMYGESKLGPREIVLYLKGLLHLFFHT